jgi:uncharacterized protein YqeY
MNLETRIMADLKDAMKSKDQVAMRSIRAIKAAILLAQTDGSGKVMNEADEIKLIQKLVKQRQDSLDIFVKQDREDLATIERDEIAVLSRYLPKQLSLEELTPIVQEIIRETGASGMKDMGKVMALASQKLAGKADGKSISTIVRQLLN